MIKKYVLAAAVLGCVFSSVEAQEAPGANPAPNASVTDSSVIADDRSMDVAASNVQSGDGTAVDPAPGVAERQVASLVSGDGKCRVLPQRLSKRKGVC